MFVCYVYGFKCVKCNSSYKIEYHRDFAWYCKPNFKINPPRLETKKGKPCSHSFKCINCKGEHQADSNAYPF